MKLIKFLLNHFKKIKKRRKILNQNFMKFLLLNNKLQILLYFQIYYQ